MATLDEASGECQQQRLSGRLPPPRQPGVTLGRRKVTRPQGRRLKQGLKKSAGRSPSSIRWLERQVNDIWTDGARREGWRSRAAYKLLQLDERFSLLGPGTRVVDLGAAPGGWSQVAASRIAGAPLVAVDVLEMESLVGVTIVVGDIRDRQTRDAVLEALDGTANLVLSDMAAPSTGHRSTDHLRTQALAEEAAAFATTVLAPGGCLVVKVLRGGAGKALLSVLRRDFVRVHHVKPEASRQQSSEIYVVAREFRGTAS